MNTADEGGARASSKAGYDAFMSYSHAADDLLAPRLQSGLQRFAKPWWRRRAMRVFRDEASLSANPHLWSSITEALDEAAWFVLLLSPDSAASEWVNREVEYWVEHKATDRILPVVTDGDFDWRGSEVIPAALTFDHEPRWVDLRFARDETSLDLKNPTFSAAIADIASAIRQVPKDELESEEVRQHRRTLRTAWTAGFLVVALALAATVAAIAAVNQSNEAQRLAQTEAQARADAVANAELADSNAQDAETQRLTAVANAEDASCQRVIAESQSAEADRNATLAQFESEVAKARELAASSIAVVEDDPELAVLLAVAALSIDPNAESPSEMVAAAYAAVAADRHIASFPMVVDTIDIRPDGAGWVVSDERSIKSFVLGTSDLQWEFELSGTLDFLDSFSISPDGQRIAVGITDRQIDVEDAGDAEFIGLELAPHPATGRMADNKPARLVILDSLGDLVEEVPVEGICLADDDVLGEAGGSVRVDRDTWSFGGAMLGVRVECRLIGDSVADRTIVFDTGSWEPLKELPPFASIGFASKSDFFWAVQGVENTASMTVYEIPAFRVVGGPHALEVGGIAPDGSKVIGQQRVRLDFALEARWSVSGELSDTGHGLDFLVSDFGVAENRSWVIAAGPQRTLVWDYESGAVVHDLPTGDLDSVVLDEASGVIYGVSPKGRVVLWDLVSEPGWAKAEQDGRWFNSNAISVGDDVAVGFVYAIDITSIQGAIAAFDRATGEFIDREADGADGMAAPIAGGRFAYVRSRVGPDEEVGPIAVWDPADGSITEVAGCWSPVPEKAPYDSLVCEDGSPRAFVPVGQDGTSTVVSGVDGSLIAGLSGSGILMTWDARSLALTSTTDITSLVPSHVRFRAFRDVGPDDWRKWTLERYDHDQMTLRSGYGLIVVRLPDGEILNDATEISIDDGPRGAWRHGIRTGRQLCDLLRLAAGHLPTRSGDVRAHQADRAG